MDEINKNQAPSPSSKKEILAGVGLFLFSGLYMALREIPYEWGWIDWTSSLGDFLFTMNFLLPVIGFGIGWVKGFPRWSYPYVGASLIAGLFLMNASTPGRSFFGYETFGRELWGWRSWIPLGLATLVALIVSRSFNPLKKFFTNGWEDWTLFTFCMFGWLPELVEISFDEIDNHYTLYFIISLNILIVLAAYAYMRSSSIWQRVLALTIGIVVPVVVASIGSTLYWLENGWVDPAGVAKISFYVVLVMFSPAFIGFLRYTRNQIPAEWETK
jgi:hypothetical protein